MISCVSYDNHELIRDQKYRPSSLKFYYLVKILDDKKIAMQSVANEILTELSNQSQNQMRENFKIRPVVHKLYKKSSENAFALAF